MKTLLLSLLLCLALLPASLAQTPAADTARQAKWEAGLDLLWLIDKNQVPATSVFFRKHTTAKSGQARAFRLRLEVNYGRNIGKPGTDSLQRDQRFLALANIGYEWRRQLDQKLVWMYGFEVPIGYHSTENGGILRDPYSGRLFKSRNFRNGLRTGLAGIMGIQYRLSHRLAVAVESRIGYAYTYTQAHYHRNYYLDNGDTQSQSAPSRYSSSTLSFAGISTVYLSYFF
jgi:hypothetical protein